MNVEPLNITRIRRTSDLEAHLDAWRDLAVGAPMRSPEWLLTWWQYYAVPGDELCVLLFHERGGMLVGLAPLYTHTDGKRTIIRLLGSGDASTNHTTWLAAPGWEMQISRGVTRILLESAPDWNMVHLEWVDGDDPSINATVNDLVEKGCLVRRTPRRHNCWIIALPPTWDAYLKMLSKSHRKQCRKLQNDFLDTGQVTVHHVTGEANFEQGFDILLKLHAARWGEANNSLGCFSDQRFREFHKTTARELLARKQLLLIWLEFNNTPVAVEYMFIDRKTVYSYQAGMDPSIVDFSPGHLSIMASIQFAIQQHCETFDLSRGDQQYKANWRAAPKACYDIRVWPKQLQGRLEHALWGVQNLAVYARKRAGRWLKARVPPRIINAGLRMLRLSGGKR